MNPGAVPPAARQGRRSAMEAADMEPDARCNPRPAPSAARIPRYLLNPTVIGQSTVAIVTVKSDRVDNIRLT